MNTLRRFAKTSRLAMLAVGCLAAVSAWGDLEWATSRSEAVSRAKAEGKYIFLVAGLNTCGKTSATRANCDAVGDLLAEKCVPWYNNLNTSSAETKDYRTGLTGQIPLPIVCIINPQKESSYVSRSVGVPLSVDDILKLLDSISSSGSASTTKYTVTFDANGGKASESRRTVKKNAKIGTLPSATRTGYKLKGWYTSSSGGTKIKASTKVTSTATYYARWTANKYTIKFNKNGGTGSMASISATYGKNVTLTANAFKRTNYSFLGWSTSKTAATATYSNKQTVKNLTSTDGGTVTLYAVWKAKASGGSGGKTYTVVFNANGGDGSMKSQKVSCGVSTALTKNSFSRDCYKFAGWAVTKGGSVAYKNKASVKDLAKSGQSVTLYAVWYPASWAVGTFEDYGEIGGNEAEVTLTVSSTGKISGKFVRLRDNTSYSFKADGFDNAFEGALYATTTLKYGSKKVKVYISISEYYGTGEGMPIITLVYGADRFGWGFLE